MDSNRESSPDSISGLRFSLGPLVPEIIQVFAWPDNWPLERGLYSVPALSSYSSLYSAHSYLQVTHSSSLLLMEHGFIMNLYYKLIHCTWYKSKVRGLGLTESESDDRSINSSGSFNHSGPLTCLKTSASAPNSYSASIHLLHTLYMKQSQKSEGCVERS